VLRFLKAGDRANIVPAPAEPSAADDALLKVIAGVELTLTLGEVANVL
jgi:hypothetical protein